jgi:hypothetical protein
MLKTLITQRMRYPCEEDITGCETEIRARLFK